jgi:SAM-dependent methyltransferase
VAPITPPPSTTLSLVQGRLERERERTREIVERALGSLGLRQSEDRLIADAAEYWADRDDPQWSDHSHWRGGSIIDQGRFEEIGAEHLALFDRLAATVGGAPDLGHVVEWGVGGGANAVHFAPRAREFVAVDVNPDSPAEAARLVAETCSTPVSELVVDVADPESIRGHLPAGTIDLFVCLYVLELVPSPAYGLRLMRLAAELLRPGALAFVQIKYSAGRSAIAPPRRNYRFFNAKMTTYRLDEFWTAMEGIDLQPLVMTLVPENALDHRYGYLLLRRV